MNSDRSLKHLQALAELVQMCGATLRLIARQHPHLENGEKLAGDLDRIGKEMAHLVPTLTDFDPEPMH